jgi:Holliday junction DNA helicase RuvA
MIAKLKGVVDQIGPDWVVIDVGGVGYLVSCASRTLARLPRVGEPAVLAIETQMREDAIHLYGFGDAAERDWFRLLQTVQGVGAKVALALLSALSLEEIQGSILSGDTKTLCRAQGVGAKVATRLVVELKDKAGAAAFVSTQPGISVEVKTSAANEAVSALVNLGYRRIEAVTAVARAAQELGEAAAIEDIVKRGLKELAREVTR